MNKEKTPENGTAPDCDFGTDINETIVPIESIVSERESVTVEGIIGDLTCRELKGAAFVLFDVVDATQSIPVKIVFRDKRLYSQVSNDLRQGMRVRVKGAVRLDAFAERMTLLAEEIQEKSIALREDNAKTKRAELHAHTQMSGMDSVLPTRKLVQTAIRWGWDAVAITDHGVVQAFPEAMNAAEKEDIKIIYGMEGYMTGDDYKQPGADHVMMLAKSQEGLKNLYRLVTLSHLQYVHRQPRIPKHELEKHRGGLLLGAAACGGGELIRAIAAGKSEEELLAIAGFYDYLEIQPVGNYASLVRSEEFPAIRTDEDLRNINRKIAELAKKTGKPLVAAGNAHFLNPEDAIFRTILRAGNGAENAENQPPLYLRTTDEMLEEFDYLGKELAYEAVVTNPRRIADMIGRLKPIPDTMHLPKIPDADETVREIAYQRAHQWYGEKLPDVVKARLDWELDAIVGHGFSVLFLIARKLVKKSNEDGYLVGSRGAVGSSFAAAMTGVTEVNPLPPHYRCPKCKYSEFIDDGSYGSGFDLPDKRCPNCGEPLVKDGHDIPAEVFLGADGDKMPDIDLNFAAEYQRDAMNHVKQLFGEDHVSHAGTISTVREKTAYFYARKYYESRGEKKNDAFLRHIAKGCVDAKRATGRHPAGLMIVPQDMDVHDFTPLQITGEAGEPIREEVTTHFDYHSISDRMLKVDVLGHDDPSILKRLQDLTGFNPKDVPFDDPQTLSLFRSTEALDVAPEALGINTGTYGIPEFRTAFVRQMLDETKPTCFSELVKISALSHGTDVWLGNGQLLIRNGVCGLRDVIATRDDVMMYLLRKGVDPMLAYRVMESVRRGKGIRPDIADQLRNAGVPEWYLKSCQKIKYLFPRAHAVAYVMMSLRIAYYKAHYPSAFYRAYFGLNAKPSDLDVIASGKEAVETRLKALEVVESPDYEQTRAIAVLQIAREMYLRGCTLTAVELARNEDA